MRGVVLRSPKLVTNPFTELSQNYWSQISLRPRVQAVNPRAVHQGADLFQAGRAVRGTAGPRRGPADSAEHWTMMNFLKRNHISMILLALPAFELTLNLSV